MRTHASCVLRPIGACCPGPPSDPATQKVITADVASCRDPSDSTKENGSKDANKTKEYVNDELLKDINIHKEGVATKHMLYALPTKYQQLLETSVEAIGNSALRPGPLL